MPHLAITIGDPTGIGPEITAKALQQVSAFPNVQLSIIGDMTSLKKTATSLDLVLPSHNHIEYLDVTSDSPGNTVFQSIETAVKLISEKRADALVTGPISKRHLQQAGHQAHGHTEILEALTHQYFNEPQARAEMLFVFKKFRLLLLTRHIPLRDVPAALAQSGAVSRPIKTLIAFLRHRLKISEPRLALLGVNPHAGEIGGDEESKYIKPVIHAVNAIGASQLVGPLPADGFFRDFDPQNSGYDAVVAAYHDQGLIPFKILAGHKAVNMTIGLPFVRTSVSHGTAEDIVGKNIAREDSLLAAIHTALDVLTAAAV